MLIIKNTQSRTGFNESFHIRNNFHRLSYLKRKCGAYIKYEVYKFRTSICDLYNDCYVCDQEVMLDNSILENYFYNDFAQLSKINYYNQILRNIRGEK